MICENMTMRQFWKRTILILILVLLTAIIYQSAFVGTLSTNQKLDVFSPNKERILVTKINKDLSEKTQNGSAGEHFIRHPTFNTSFLYNKCRRSAADPGDPDHVDLRVFVLTYNRAVSMKRLLVSLMAAYYDNDSVVIEVWIDRSKDGIVDEETLRNAESMKFDRGVLRVCVHEKHVGILGQWLIPYKPKTNSKEIAVLLEDDLTVSPHFYRYLKIVHSKYRNKANINGFALQGISMKHNGEPGNVDVPSKHQVYLYPTLGTWGFSPSARYWADFVRWFEQIYNDVKFEPTIPNFIGTSWYKSFIRGGKEDGYWEMWFIYHSWMTHEWTLYPTFSGHKGLTFNWKENGLHYQGQSVKDETEDQKHLLLEWKPEFENLPENPIHVDNRGHIITPKN